MILQNGEEFCLFVPYFYFSSAFFSQSGWHWTPRWVEYYGQIFETALEGIVNLEYLENVLHILNFSQSLTSYWKAEKKF